MATVRLMLCLAATMLSGTNAWAQSSPQLDEFEKAMAAADQNRAADLLDEIAAARRWPGGALRPDPLLSALVGRYYLLSGEARFARAYLEQAHGDGLPADLRAPTTIALAAAEERVGDRRAALSSLRALAGAALTADQHRTAQLAEARMVIVEDPLAALKIASAVTGAAGNGAERWEAELLIAQAHALRGERDAAEAAANRAWASAATAPVADLAPMRVALQRAALAAGRNDRDTLLAMLNLAKASSAGVDSTIVAYLPLCGEAGILPGDHVTFAVYGDAQHGHALAAVAASRAEIVAPFFDSLAGRALFEPEDRSPSGTVFTVRCGTVPSAAFDFPVRRDRWSEWFASRGLTFSFNFGPSLDDINALSSQIAAIEQRYGQDNAFLIPLRLSLKDQLLARAATEGDVEEWQVNDLNQKAMTAMRAIGSATGLVPTEEQEREQRAADHATSVQAAAASYRRAAKSRVETSPDDDAYSYAMEWFGGDTDLPTDQQMAVVDALFKRFKGRKNDPRRTALLMRMAEIQDGKEDHKAARASRRMAGAPDDLCVSAEDPPMLQDGSIMDQAYPHDAMRYMLKGVSILEYAIDPAGRVEAPRLLLSSPATLFDAVAIGEIGKFRFTPARAGQAHGCRGKLQRVIWNLPEREEPAMPRFREPSTTAT